MARETQEKTTNAVLLNLNQVGTVSKTIEAIEMCRKAGLGICDLPPVHETGPDFLADFAVAMGGGQIKTGSACRSERIAKYNRLLEIRAEFGRAATFGRYDEQGGPMSPSLEHARQYVMKLPAAACRSGDGHAEQPASREPRV